MEPFGLLNFLKTILPVAEEEVNPAPKKEEERAPSPPTIEEEKENAYLSFIAAHERRAKRK